MNKFRQTGSIYSNNKTIEKTSVLRQINANIQRTFNQGDFKKYKQSTDVSKTTTKWAYDYDNIQSEKTQPKSSVKSYEFESFQNSLNSSKIDAANEQCYVQQMNSIQTQQRNEQNSVMQDSLAQYQNIYDPFMSQTTIKSDYIVKKLTCLNNIFKQIKQFKRLNISGQINHNLSVVEDSLLAIQREIIRSQTTKSEFRRKKDNHTKV